VLKFLSWENGVLHKACVFMMFASLKEDCEKGVDDLPIVQEFPKDFSDDNNDLPRERDLEFAINLVLGIIPILITPYRMSVS